MNAKMSKPPGKHIDKKSICPSSSFRLLFLLLLLLPTLAFCWSIVNVGKRTFFASSLLAALPVYALGNPASSCNSFLLLLLPSFPLFL
jgi:hypothetical protein